LKKKINVDYLARVEGESGISIEIKNDIIERINLTVFEAPRFFEPILKERPAQDVIDFTARICGICPVAYQMSAVHAIEKIFDVPLPEPIHKLRRLFYCGEWIESHALHIYLLHGPDFYNLESAWASQEYLPLTQRGFMLKKAGNQLLSVIGGRPVHPISARVGGFYKVPSKKTLQKLLPDLEMAYEESLKGISWSASLFTRLSEHDEIAYECVALKHPQEYPMTHGRVVSTHGLDFAMEEFLEIIEEYQVPYSTSLHSGIKNQMSTVPYIVGPLARLNINFDLLPEEIKSKAKESGLSLPLKDVNTAIYARSIELAFALYEAIDIIKNYEEPERPWADYEPRQGRAVWITEAPRGILIHSYEFDRYGKVLESRIIPPTSQNLAHMEKSLTHYVNLHIHKPIDYLTKECERIIRSYDPCISCSVHLLVIKQ
jgi:sulfhydrogenase subunit alpha